MNTHSSSVPLTDGQQAAQERMETPEGRREFWRATFSCWLGTTMEYADFALYGLAAGIIFGDVFFRRLPLSWRFSPALPPIPLVLLRAPSARCCLAG
jgi:hypothetical protein